MLKIGRARAAEMHTALRRPLPNTDVPLTEHPKIKSFDGLA